MTTTEPFVTCSPRKPPRLSEISLYTAPVYSPENESRLIILFMQKKHTIILCITLKRNHDTLSLSLSQCAQ